MRILAVLKSTAWRIPQIIAEYDNNGTLLRKFIYSPGTCPPSVWWIYPPVAWQIYEPVCMINVANGHKYYYHHDGLGSVVALSDVNGVIVKRYSYDVFGESEVYNCVGHKKYKC